MSTIEELASSEVTIFITPKRGIIPSIIVNLFTFSFLGLCIYVSQGNAWWTFFTGASFLFLMWCKLSTVFKDNHTTFEDKEAAIKYLTGL